MLNIRKPDKWGDGAYGARRDEGRRRHSGVDIATAPGAPVHALCDCEYVRQNRPYASDASYVGMTMRDAQGRTIKYFYVRPAIQIGAHIICGDMIGHAMDISKKYPGITNHYHFEVWENGKTIDPLKYLDAARLL
jgi:hypothetical protein